MMQQKKDQSPKYTNSSCSSISKKEKAQSKIWAEDLSRPLPEKVIQMVNKHMKRCSITPSIREMQIKTTTSYHFTPVSIAVIKKKSTDIKCWTGCEEKGTFLHC